MIDINYLILALLSDFRLNKKENNYWKGKDRSRIR